MGWLLGIPSVFWSYLSASLSSLKSFLSGAIVTKLWDNLQRSKRLNEQLADILEVEREVRNSARVGDVPERVRRFYIDGKSKP